MVQNTYFASVSFSFFFFLIYILFSIFLTISLLKQVNLFQEKG